MSVSVCKRPPSELPSSSFYPPAYAHTGHPLRWITAADVLAQQALLRHPDFVVARMKGQYWQVREKVFDYEGRFRRAHELRG